MAIVVEGNDKGGYIKRVVVAVVVVAVVVAVVKV